MSVWKVTTEFTGADIFVFLLLLVFLFNLGCHLYLTFKDGWNNKKGKKHLLWNRNAQYYLWSTLVYLFFYKIVALEVAIAALKGLKN